MDVKNSPAGHVTEKCAIRQMSFSTDDGNEYYEPAHLFTPVERIREDKCFGRNIGAHGKAAASAGVF